MSYLKYKKDVEPFSKFNIIGCLKSIFHRFPQNRVSPRLADMKQLPGNIALLRRKKYTVKSV
jgi:hypothetical protein